MIPSLIMLLLMASPAVDPVSEAGLRKAELVEELPDFAPLKRRYQEGWHAALSPGYTFVSVEQAGEDRGLFFILHRTEQGSSLGQLSLSPTAGSHLEGRYKAGVEAGFERVLLVRLDQGNRSLSYKWLTEKSTVLSRGDKITDEKLSSLDGESFSITGLRGKWVVLNWWATFCVPCREEIPDLNRLARNRAGNDIVFLAVALDDADTVRRFLRKHPFEYRQSLGGPELEKVLGNEFPRHLVIAPDGTIVGDIVGGSSDVAMVLGDEIDRARRRLSTKR